MFSILNDFFCEHYLGKLLERTYSFVNCDDFLTSCFGDNDVAGFDLGIMLGSSFLVEDKRLRCLAFFKIGDVSERHLDQRT